MGLKLTYKTNKKIFIYPNNINKWVSEIIGRQKTSKMQFSSVFKLEYIF